MKSHYQILIIGGGQAGISVAAKLLAINNSLDIAIVDPSEKHYYQPGLTLVGGGIITLKQIIRNEADFIPSKAQWIKDAADLFDPDNNLVTLKSGEKITYDYMVVCCGIQLNWGHIKGMKEAIGKGGVCSNYHFDLAPYTYDCIKDFKGGRALFTQPSSLIKCGAAPQKIMYLAADNFRRRGLLSKADISFYTGKPGLLRVKEVHASLLKIAARYGINLSFQSNLLEVKGENKQVVIEVMRGEEKEVVTLDYEMLHVTPQQSAPDCIKNSPLATPDDPQGWVDVDINFQHKGFPNIFSIGDVANLGDTKTGAAIIHQAPLMINNLIAMMKKEPVGLGTKYNGYTACLLTTAYGRLLLAEFDQNSNLTPTIPLLDPAKEHYLYWLFVRYILPYVYWNRILGGKI